MSRSHASVYLVLLACLLRPVASAFARQASHDLFQGPGFDGTNDVSTSVVSLSATGFVIILVAALPIAVVLALAAVLIRGEDRAAFDCGPSICLRRNLPTTSTAGGQFVRRVKSPYP